MGNSIEADKEVQEPGNVMENELKSLQSKIMDLETKLCFTKDEEPF